MTTKYFLEGPHWTGHGQDWLGYVLSAAAVWSVPVVYCAEYVYWEFDDFGGADYGVSAVGQWAVVWGAQETTCQLAG